MRVVKFTEQYFQGERNNSHKNMFPGGEINQKKIFSKESRIIDIIFYTVTGIIKRK